MRWKLALTLICMVLAVTAVAAADTANTMETMETEAQAAEDAKVETTARADGRVKCADVTLERPYQGVCVNSNGEKMQVDVSAKTEASATGDSKTIVGGYALIRESAISAILNAANTGEDYFLLPKSAIHTVASIDDADCDDTDADVKPGTCKTDVTGEITLEEGRELTLRTDGNTPTGPFLVQWKADAGASGTDGDSIAEGVKTSDANTKKSAQNNENDSNFVKRLATRISAFFGGNNDNSTPDARDMDDDGDDVPGASDDAGGDDSQTGTQEPVTLTSDDIGRTLSDVWDGGFTAKTGDGTVLIGWNCEIGDFHATEFYGKDTTVTRTKTAGAAHNPSPSPVSHVGYMDDTTSTLAAGAWKVSSDHDDREPPADCTATIKDVQGEVEIMEYQEGGVNEKTHSVTLHSGEIQIAAESRIEDGNAAVYRLAAGDEQKTAQVAYGTIHLTDLPDGEQALDAPDDSSLVTTVTIRDQTVASREQEQRDAVVWQPDITDHADQLYRDEG